MKADKFFKIFFLFGLILIFSGCVSSKKEADILLPQEISGYGITITKASTPQDVARLLIQGVDNKDEALLAKLVAVKDGKKKTEEIFAKYGRREKWPYDAVAKTAASGWQATYSFYDKFKTRIIEEKIEGELAFVKAAGINRVSQQERKFEIRLIKEDNLWRVRMGIQPL